MIRVSYDFDTQSYRLSIVTAATTHDTELDEDEASQLVKDLIRAGVIVTSDKELALQYKLEAQTAHLNDMRRLVLLENDKGEV